MFDVFGNTKGCNEKPYIAGRQTMSMAKKIKSKGKQ
jgi:hypothetical protein